MSSGVTHSGYFEQGAGYHTGELLAAAVTGGVVSEISGGKFSNGAVYGSYQYLLNAAMEGGTKQIHQGKIVVYSSKKLGLGEGFYDGADFARNAYAMHKENGARIFDMNFPLDVQNLNTLVNRNDVLFTEVRYMFHGNEKGVYSDNLKLFPVEEFSKYNGKMADGGRIVMEACSSGNATAYMQSVANVAQTKVIGPTYDIWVIQDWTADGRWVKISNWDADNESTRKEYNSK